MKTDFKNLIKNNMSDLHLHFDGSISYDIIDKVTKMQPDKKIENWDKLTIEEKIKKLSIPPNCNSLNEYLKLFDYPCSLLQDDNMVRIAMKMLVKKLEKQGYVYADIRFAPQLCSTELRNNFKEKTTQNEQIQLFNHELKIVEAALKGIKDARLDKMEANIVLCCMRNKKWDNLESENIKSNLRTIQIANLYDLLYSKENKKDFPKITRLDLAGGEEGNPNMDYKELYEEYKRKDFSQIKLTIHSGEAGTPEEKIDNLKYVINNTEANIGHGVALALAYDDNVSEDIRNQSVDLINKLAKTDRVLEICLTSNYQTKAINGIHPIVKLIMGDKCKNIASLEKNITINTDNIVISNTSLEKEFQIFIDICKNAGLSEEKIKKYILHLKINSIKQANMNLQKKEEIIKEIEETI
ncbi:MAG: hypothetical protein Q4G09_06405 [Clostridia bacterium]|nr:hypothetical protein [Clostridia bacterium]